MALAGWKVEAQSYGGYRSRYVCKFEEFSTAHASTQTAAKFEVGPMFIKGRYASDIRTIFYFSLSKQEYIIFEGTWHERIGYADHR